MPTLVKISDLSTQPALTATALLEIEQAGVSYKATVNQVAEIVNTALGASITSQITTGLEASALTEINSQTASYTLALADAGKVIRLTNASATTLTIPTNASVAFAIGVVIAVRQVGTGQITIAGPGLTLNVPTGFTAKTGRQHASVMLHKVGTNEWDLTGDMDASA